MALTQIVNDGLGASLTATSEGGAVTTSIQQGIAKAWVNLNGTGTIAARDSFNNSALTDLAAGEYTVSYTNSLSNTNYAPHVTSSSNNGYNIDGCSLACIANNLTNPYVNTGSVSVMTSLAANGNGQDFGAVVMVVSVLGDLA